MTTNTKITGFDAIDYAAETGAVLHKYADPMEDEREGLTLDEARDVAREDENLIWCIR